MTILIVEDDPVNTRLVGSLLTRWGYEVVTAGNGEEALQILERERTIPLAIMDWMMPRMDGIELCREIRKRFNEPYIYIILLTTRDQPEDVVKGFEAGADDYLIKPVHNNELNARIRAAKRIIDLQRELLATQEVLRIQATHDSLTGLWNRGAIFEALGRELDRARRQENPLAVVMIDLDHFKRINDTHGHLIGDEVLWEVAKRVGNAVRSYDYVGRYGGEEFLVIAPGFDGDRAMDLAERIRCLFEKTPIPTSGPTLRLTLSAGVVTLEKGQNAEINKLLSAVDDALYRAKSNGRNVSVMGTIPAS